MSDDDYGDDDGGGGGGASHEVGFDDETAGVLIAGHSCSLGGLTRTGLGKLKLALDELNKAKGVSLTLVPSGDYSETGPGPDDDCWGEAVIGVQFLSDGTYGPVSFSRDNVLAKLEQAKAVSADVWQAVANLLPESRREEFLDSEIDVQLVPVGPLAYAMVAFGTEGSEEDAGEGEFSCGTHMDQERHDTGVWGQKVARGEDPVEVDFSQSAHEARVAAFPSGQYYLIARYD